MHRLLLAAKKKGKFAWPCDWEDWSTKGCVAPGCGSLLGVRRNLVGIGEEVKTSHSVDGENKMRFGMGSKIGRKMGYKT